MEYLTTDTLVLYLTTATNVLYGALFVWHLIGKNTNKSLMILSGCMCVAMLFVHSFTVYKNELDKMGLMYYHIVVNQMLIWILLNAVIFTAIAGLHRALNVRYHYVTRYVFRCIVISVLLNMAMHIDLIVLENKEPWGLWTLYSWGENLMTLFMFLSILVARRWSEVFRWLRSAHSQ